MDNLSDKNMRKKLIGVMGPGNEATEADVARAFELGKLIAKCGWVLLSGGGNRGVMDAVNQGAKSENGLTVGILAADDYRECSSAVDIAIVSGMGSARNNINVLSSDVIIACGVGAGTASEIALALKAKKQVIILNDYQSSKKFFAELGKERIHIVENPQDAVTKVKELLS